MDKDGADDQNPADEGEILFPSVLAVAIFCAVVARLPTEFDIQAYPSLDLSDLPLACFGRASARIGDAAGWWCSNLMEPLGYQARDVIIDRLCGEKLLSRK